MTRVGCLTLAFGALIATASNAATPFDGTYTGSVTRAGGPIGRDKCGSPSRTIVRIVDGEFRWADGGEHATVHVGADGAFSAQSGRRYLNGQIADGQLKALTRGEYCHDAWSFTRRP